MTDAEALNYYNSVIEGRDHPISESQRIEFAKVASKSLSLGIPKDAVYHKIVHGKHTWETNEDDSVDLFAWMEECHNGPVCTVCGESPCVYCDPDWEKREDCVEVFHTCPTCGKKVAILSKFCDCGQKLNFTEK